jgi:hypothetical protein
MNPVLFYELGRSSPLIEGLLSAYKLDNNSNDATGLSPNGTDTSITYGSGKVHNCANFNGSAWINLTDSNNFSYTNGTNDIPFSGCFWVYFTSFNSVGNWLVNKRNNTSGGDEYQIMYYTDRLYFGKVDKSNNSITQAIGSPTFPFSLNTWYFISYTDDGSQTVAGMKIYINGALQIATNLSSGSYTGMVNGPAPLVFGTSAWDVGNVNLSHIGKMEGVYLWKNRELTLADITYLYNSGNGRAYPF